MTPATVFRPPLPRSRRIRTSSAARGYGPAHQRLRAKIRRLVDGGMVACWRCGRPIVPGSRWHLGHDDDDRRRYRGAEHAVCNESAAGRKGRRLQALRAGKVTSRAW